MSYVGKKNTHPNKLSANGCNGMTKIHITNWTTWFLSLPNAMIIYLVPSVQYA